jgi:GNAT superfamily N-acetyltransferase
MPDYQIDEMTEADLGLVIEWAAAEGWNPGRHDAPVFYATDPRGFLIGRLDGEPVASISAVSYGEAFGFLGFYIVRPEFRGRGLGLQIWQQAISRMAGRNIGLDGVVAQQDNYRRSGFELAYRNFRFGGRSDPALSGRAAEGLVDAASLPFEALAAYDRRAFPSPRDAFLRGWLHLPEATALAAVDSGAVTGYGVVRPSRQGFRIGPLFDDDEASAERLLLGLQAALPAGSGYYLDVPEVNPAALRLAERFGLQPSFETARMYTQGRPPGDTSLVYGVTTLELG